MATSIPGLRQAELDEESIGGLVTRLVAEGKDYARAEADLYKTIAVQRGKSSATGLALAVVGFLIVCSAITALLVGFVLGLAVLVGPVLAGIIVFLVSLAVGGGLAYLGVRSIQAAFASKEGAK